jgi:hypothetical protein
MPCLLSRLLHFQTNFESSAVELLVKTARRGGEWLANMLYGTTSSSKNLTPGKGYDGTMEQTKEGDRCQSLTRLHLAREDFVLAQLNEGHDEVTIGEECANGAIDKFRATSLSPEI